MTKEILQTGIVTISKVKPSSVIIVDEVDCNMTFHLLLVEDNEHKKSYTKYVVNSSSDATIIITNPSKGSVHPTKMIEVGSYQKKYRLFFNYILAAQDESKTEFDDRKLEYCFIISPIESV